MSLPRLLAGTHDGRPLTLLEHETVHGPAGPGGPDLIDAVERSGLHGRGGAAFPTAVKLRAVARARGPRTVLVNAAEGDLLSAKDRTLLALAPHLVLDGAVAAAEAVGARSVVVAVPRAAGDAHAALRSALAERSRRPAVTVTGVPAAYLAGEESALVRHLNGGPLKPTTVPPRPSDRGLRRRPTLVQNPETLAHMALIGRHGAEWFRELGTDDDPGSALVTVSGAVAAPGVQEIALGAALSDVLAPAGTGIGAVRAALVGGYHGVWVAHAELTRATLQGHARSRFACSLGAGAIVAIDAATCPVRELAAAISWLAAQSAGQCGPCANGLPALAALIAAVADGRAPRGARATLERWSGLLRGRGACHLPDGAAGIALSGLRVFADELADHARHGPCEVCDRAPRLAPVDVQWRAAA